MANSKNNISTGDVFFSEKYGFFRVLTYINCNSVYIEFVSTGYKCTVTAQQIRKSRVKDRLKPIVYGVGFVGVGSHKTANRGVNTEAYKKWIQMLRRCYCNPRSVKNKAYIGCVVCDDWHNFQNFADWFYINYPCDGKAYDLDKDLNGTRQKIYSPDSCSFIGGEENSILARVGNLSTEYAIEKSGVVYKFSNMNQMAKSIGGNCGGLSRLLSGEYKQYKGYVKHG